MENMSMVSDAENITRDTTNCYASCPCDVLTLHYSAHSRSGIAQADQGCGAEIARLDPNGMSVVTAVQGLLRRGDIIARDETWRELADVKRSRYRYLWRMIIP